MDVATENQEQGEGIDEISFKDSSGESDLTLKIEDKKIYGCKAVLCIASPVFKAMLKTEFREKDQTEIELPGKKYEDFVEFLCCVYPDKLKLITGFSYTFMFILSVSTVEKTSYITSTRLWAIHDSPEISFFEKRSVSG
jgi:hypothetical protein